MRPTPLLFLLPLAVTCAHSPPRTQTDEFADCVKRTGSVQLGTDKGAQLGADVDIAAAHVKTVAELKDKLDEKYTPNGDVCVMRQIVEGCFATATRSARREVNCPDAASKQTAAPAAGTTRPAAMTTGSASPLAQFTRKRPSRAVMTSPTMPGSFARACTSESINLCGCLPQTLKKNGTSGVVFQTPQVYDVACCYEVGDRFSYHSCDGNRCDDSGDSVNCVAR